MPAAFAERGGRRPGRGPATVEEFHRQNVARQDRWPRSLVCTSTHDTKRSEDTRARISVLSEIPHRWRTALYAWARINRRRRREVDGQPAPNRNDEWLFYQSLVGVWPLAPPREEQRIELLRRMQAYMEKATREAKVATSWINPNPGYDAAVAEFIAAALDDRAKNRFLAEFGRFHAQVVRWGLYSALSQVLLKLTSPGVPDVYQGQELWDFSLVDPDNRRPVDFARRRAMLAELAREAEGGAEAALALARRLAADPSDRADQTAGHLENAAVPPPPRGFVRRGRASPAGGPRRAGEARLRLCAAAGCVRRGGAAIGDRRRAAAAGAIDAAGGQRLRLAAAAGRGGLGRHAAVARRVDLRRR